MSDPASPPPGASCGESADAAPDSGSERLADYLMLARLGVRMHAAGASTQAAYESMREVLARDGDIDWLDAALPRLRREEPLVAQFAVRTARNVLARIALPRMRRDCLLVAVPVWLAEPVGRARAAQAWSRLATELVGHLCTEYGLEPEGVCVGPAPEACESVAGQALSMTAVRTLGLAAGEGTVLTAPAPGPQLWPMAVSSGTPTVSTLQAALQPMVRTDLASQRWSARAEALLESAGIHARVSTPTTWENAFSAARLLGLRQALRQARARGVLESGSTLVLEHEKGVLRLTVQGERAFSEGDLVIEAPFPDETVEDLRRIVQAAARSLGLSFKGTA